MNTSTKTQIQIRNFTPDDYQHLMTIHNACYPDEPVAPDDYLNGDKQNNQLECKFKRWLVEVDHQMVAWADYCQYPREYHPNKFQLNINVLPEYQRQGIGTHLYQTICDDLAHYDPQVLRISARDDKPGGAFLGQLGFEAYFHARIAALDLQTFDVSSYPDPDTKIESLGLQIKTLIELEASDPDIYRKIWDADWEITRDEPGSEDDTRSTYESLHAWFTTDKNLLHDGYFLVMDGEDIVGMTFFNKQSADEYSLMTGMTGVKRPYRRKGVATALKVRSIVYAKAHGYHTIKTQNEIRNAPMININNQLGFTAQPAWIRYEKILDTLEAS